MRGEHVGSIEGLDGGATGRDGDVTWRDSLDVDDAEGLDDLRRLGPHLRSRAREGEGEGEREIGRGSEEKGREREGEGERGERGER